MNVTRPDRRVLTFYSFKGGVGRSMALANVAFRLAERNDLDVIVVDWDLEAPGLHRFFGVSDKLAATKNGLLDYLFAWRGAVESGAEAPPDVTGWLIPVVGKKKPKHGSLSLLLAGRLDEGYADRLRTFDWHPFYRFDAGATAIETLRKQLAGRADVVLIDSRTGVTDAGGVCTIQMPDGVVLMTAANDQSFKGIERVARAIAAGEGERAGREQAKVWVAVGRAPYLDVPEGENWFDRYGAQFEKGCEAGLWAKADHPRGLRSHRLPHVGRWGFGEQLLPRGVESDDPLAVAYGALSDELLQWATGKESPKASQDEGPSRGIDDLRRAAEQAEERGDLARLGGALMELGEALFVVGDLLPAAEVLQKAIGVQLGRGDVAACADARLWLGIMLQYQGRFDEGGAELRRALSAFRTLKNRMSEGDALNHMARSHYLNKDPETAEALYERAIELDPTFCGNYAGMLLAVGRQADGLALLDRAMSLPRDVPPPLLLRSWFYAFAHRAPPLRREALAQLKRLIVIEKARASWWNFSGNIERAQSDGHPDATWLPLLGDVIAKRAEPSVLDAWPAWAAA